MKKRLIIVAIAVLVAAAGIYFWQNSGDKPITQAEAIKQAQEFKPQANCTQSLVAAVHKATGAKYTFSSGCLPPGWERVQ